MATIIPDAIPVGATGKNLNATQVTTAAGVVDNEVVTIGDGGDPNALAEVQSTKPSAGDYGVTVRQATDYTLPVYDRAQAENINGTMDYEDPWYPKQLQDFFDVAQTNATVFTPLQTSPAGIDTPGKTSASQSLPVTLANEDTYDLFIQAAGSPPGSLGANILSPNTGTSRSSLDCLQYRSIGFQTICPVGVTVTLSFEASNDNVNFVNVPMFDAAAATTAPVLTVAQGAGSVRFWVGPLNFRYFRARISGVVSGGIVTAFTRLSIAPFSPIENQVFNSAGNWSTNVSQFAGSAIVTAGVAGTLAVGGNVTQAVTPTANPLLIAGVDATINVVGGGATPLTRRLLTDTTGAQIITGPTVPVTTSSALTTTQPLIVAGTQYPNSGTQQPITQAEQNSTQANERLNELLTKVLNELQAQTRLIKELPLYLNTGLQIMDEGPAPFESDVATNISLN